MNPELHIVALGACTPVGYSAESAAAAVRSGIARLQRVEAGASDLVLCRDTALGVTTGVERMLRLASSALAQLLDKLASAGWRSEAAVPVLLGLPETRPGWGAGEQAQLLSALADGRCGSRRLLLEPVCQGHAAAIESLRQAHRLVQTGQFPLVVVGGVDSYHHPETLAWLRQERRWLGSDVRSGLIPGEGAGFVALSSPAEMREGGLVSQARVGAVASSRETKLLRGNELSLGEGLSAAVKEALATLSSQGQLVDEVYGDINGERYRAEEWGFVALRLGAAFRDASACNSAAGRWGDVGAATAALNLILATRAWQRGYAQGVNTMVWGSSEGGLRVAALLAAPTAAGGSPWVA